MTLWEWMGFCKHQWDVKDHIQVVEPGQKERPHAYIYVLRCSKCGNVKDRKVSFS